MEDNGPVIVGVTWWLTFFCGGFLALRIYVRRRALWWDDWTLLFAWVMLLIEAAVTQANQSLGFGKHVYDVRPVANLSQIALYTAVGASVSCFASTFSKISFGVTLLRLTHGAWRAFVWFAVATLFLVMLPSALLTWVVCQPVQKAWNPYLEGTCWDPSIVTNYGVFNAAWCTLMDFALALLPWKLVWGLQMRTSEKIGVSVAMSMGLLSGICAIVKGVYIVQLRQDDFSYNGVDVTIWTAVETATAIIGASLPVLRVFLKIKVAAASRDQNNGPGSGGGDNVGLSDLKISPPAGLPPPTIGTQSQSPKRRTGGLWTMMMTTRRDDESEKSILGGSRNDSGALSGIVRMDTFTIDYSEDRHHVDDVEDPSQHGSSERHRRSSQELAAV
ncbi:hypothetical protein F4778DRAFT_781283 [Xylariomycetidae sp. FL2044]|nr:hypothetical protein F4778DRAFT_781283 [Xylariomycetidae sp. FL2044]